MDAKLHNNPYLTTTSLCLLAPYMAVDGRESNRVGWPPTLLFEESEIPAPHKFQDTT